MNCKNKYYLEYHNTGLIALGYKDMIKLNSEIGNWDNSLVQKTVWKMV